MSGHTPGPWKFQASPAHGYRIRTTESGPRLMFGSGDVAVVFFAGNGRSQEQCKADAKLIAAAPLLLEALQASQTAIRQMRENGAPQALWDDVEAANLAALASTQS